MCSSDVAELRAIYPDPNVLASESSPGSARRLKPRPRQSSRVAIHEPDKHVTVSSRHIIAGRPGPVPRVVTWQSVMVSVIVLLIAAAIAIPIVGIPE
jgi:hypothetical protein